MIKGINGQPYLDMMSYIDLETFDNLQPEIIKGFALAREYAKEATWMQPGMKLEDASYIINWKPIHIAMKEFLALPDDDPIKQVGKTLMPKDFKNFKERNIFTRYLKMAMGAYDPYIYYYLWEEGSWDDRTAPRKLTPEANYFPNVVKWVEDMISNDIFESVGRVIFFVCDHDGIPFEHRDLDISNGLWDSNKFTMHRNEFIHIRPNLKKPFYVWDPEKQNKIYINSRAAWWNDQDWHGGDRLMQQSYGLRIDGKFTENFRKKLKIDHLEGY